VVVSFLRVFFARDYVVACDVVVYVVVVCFKFDARRLGGETNSFGFFVFQRVVEY
jgi:hypothetical protein